MRISDWSSDVCSSDLETHIADGRARLAANAQELGGDRLTLRLDASPEDNRLNIEGSLNAPADGLIASLAGFDRPVAATLSGKGDWEAWRSEEHTSELQSLMRISYAVFWLKNKNTSRKI